MLLEDISFAGNVKPDPTAPLTQILGYKHKSRYVLIVIHTQTHTKSIKYFRRQHEEMS